jgi:exopolysaccharide biosynthesis polyprenyl glycosylphosphotransferase
LLCRKGVSATAEKLGGLIGVTADTTHAPSAAHGVLRVRAEPPTAHVQTPALSGGWHVLKPGLDRLGAAVLLLALSPVFVLVACLIKSTSRGPALFCQTRVGRDGQEFRLYKFRSMINGADEQVSALLAHNEHDGVLFKMRQDPRVTPVGRLLRRFSVDELPQLWNVLRGQMSLVGPRPPLPSEVMRYGDDVRRRLLVKPGLTGLWQVSGRAELSWEETVRLDLYYTENWSFALDLRIVCKTLFVVLRGRGAY